MKILNVIVLDMGMMESCKSFPVIAQKDKKTVIKEAEDYFIERIKEWGDVIDDIDVETIIGEENYSDGNGNEIFLVWSK